MDVQARNLLFKSIKELPDDSPERALLPILRILEAEDNETTSALLKIAGVEGFQFEYSDFNGEDFSGDDLRAVSYLGCNLLHTNFTKSDVSDACMISCRGRAISFRFVTGDGFASRECRFEGLNASNAQLNSPKFLVSSFKCDG